MGSPQVPPGPLIVGGAILSVWLYFQLIPSPFDVDLMAWFLFGVLGLALAGAMWGTRSANMTVRMVVWVGLGVVLGMLGLAAVLQEASEVTAAFLTATGGAIIVTALPGPSPAA